MSGGYTHIPAIGHVDSHTYQSYPSKIPLGKHLCVSIFDSVCMSNQLYNALKVKNCSKLWKLNDSDLSQRLDSYLEPLGRISPRYTVKIRHMRENARLRIRTLSPFALLGTEIVYLAL